MLDEHGFDELVRDNGHRKGTRRHDATSNGKVKRRRLRSIRRPFGK